MPEAAEAALVDMRGGTSATIEASLHAPGQAWDVVFEDGTANPFSIAIDKRQIYRAMLPGKRRLAVWTERGRVLDLVCEVRT